MENTNTGWGKFVLGLGILAAISGIYMIFQQDYIGGITGTLVGALLVYMNMKEIIGNKSE